MWLLMWLGGWYQEDMGMKSVVLAMMALAAISGLAEAAPSATESVEVKQCEALASTDFSRIQDAPTQITEAILIKRKDDLPAHCQVKGYVTPQVGFEIRLPVDNWNGKFMETGCGGSCGVITIDWLCPGPLQKGYACITTDMGHEDRSGGGLWAYNSPQEEIDWGFRATHVTAIAGKAITEQYYRKTALHENLTRPSILPGFGFWGFGVRFWVKRNPDVVVAVGMWKSRVFCGISKSGGNGGKGGVGPFARFPPHVISTANWL